MKKKHPEITQKILLLLKLDSNNLFKRIKERKTEYLEVFALRRTREHFPSIFRNKYHDFNVTQLSRCGLELILILDEFYNLADDLNWYLYCTEDMPNTVEDFIERKIRRMEKLLNNLNLYLDAELGSASEENNEMVTVEDSPDME